MQAIREVRVAIDGRITLDIPHDFLGQQLEIIIIPIAEPRPTRSQKANLLGCLHEYANPELIAREKDAWLDSVRDNDESR